MAKYTADIEIAIRGGREVDGLIKSLNKLNNSINVINKNAKRLKGNVASMENYSRAVSKAENALRKAAQNTWQEERAVKSLVSAMELENKARSRRNFLIAQEVANRRQVIATANAGFGAQGPQAANIRAGRGPASPIRGTATMAGSPAALGAATSAGGGRGMAGRLGGAISGGIIGGAFPLLFGQGGGAATGGAIGGFLGGLAGPGGSFAGSLIGTLLGDIASKGQAVKQLGQDLGFSAQQTQVLATAFKTANTDVEKFTAVIQNIRGVGLELEDQAKAVQLVTRLTENYKASFEKVGNAITSALESGKVSQATLNQLTSQGINIQGALADKFNVSRDTILDMAKKGKISVQDLIDTLVELGNKPAEVANKTQTASQQLQNALSNLTKIVGPELERLTQLFVQFGVAALNALNGVLTRLGQVGTAIENALAGDTLKNAQQQFRRDAQKLKELYKTPKEERSPQQVQQITALETLQKGRSAVIQGAKPQAPAALQTFKVPSQAVPAGGKGKSTAADEARKLANLQGQVSLNERVLTLQAQINNATLSGNKAAEFALKFELELEKSAAKVAEIKRSGESAATKAAQIQEAEQERLQVLRDLTFERQKSDAEQQENKKKSLEEVFTQLDMELVQVKAITDAEKDAIKFLEIENQLKDKGVELTNTDTEAIHGKIAAITKAAQAQQTANNRADELTALYEGVANQIAGGVGTAIDAVANSTDNLGQVLADVGRQILATVGQMLIFYGLAQGLGALSGGDTFGVFGQLAKAFGFKGKAAANGAYWSGGFQAFADGGMVTRPTMGLIGEGGEAEYIIPASKMRGAMNRYAAGARGASVIPAGSDGGDGMTATMTAPAAIDVRYTVERINSVDYVTADQFQRGMQQAASQGAARGEQRALATLRQNTTQRRRIGL